MVRSMKRKSKEIVRASSAKKNVKVSHSNDAHRLQKNRDENDNSFLNILRIAGLECRENIFTTNQDIDQHALQHKIFVLLKTHENYPEILDEFCEGFEEEITENDRFLAYLMPTQKETSDENSSFVTSQDSAVKLLLGIEKLQARIINCLLEKLAVLSADDGTLQPHFQGHEIDLPRLIINQFRWLDRIIDAKALIDKILEVIPVAELAIQREIISCIPEVVEDAKHGEIAVLIKDSFLQNSQLTNAVIDAFSNLNLRGITLTEVRKSVLDILNSANLEDCPAAVRFILQSVTDNDCMQVIRDLRERLNFNENEREDEIFSISSAKKEKDRDQELLTLDVVRLALRFQKSVAGGWLKVVEATSEHTEHKIIDFFALMVMHGINTRKKTIEALFRQKIKSDVFDADVAEQAFKTHWQAFADLYKDVLAIAESLLRSPDIVVSNYGAKLYRFTFTSFDTYCKQEAIGALIMHVGSGLTSEIEAAFDVLTALVADHPKEMAPFTVFLKSILDYMDNLSVSQIRSLFFMLSSLMVHNSNEEQVFEDDMNILIRKHLSNPSIQYKKIGLIGAAMMAANMAKKGNSADELSLDLSNSEVPSALNSGVFKEVVSLLEMSKNCIAKDREAAGLFYDELSDVVAKGSIHPAIVHWISENFVTKFQDDFLVDVENTTGNKSIELVFDLDEPEDGGIAVNIFPLLLQAETQNQSGSSKGTSASNMSNLLFMNSLFRLLATCEKVEHQGNLEGIDALLGCPLVIFKMDSLDNFDTLDSGGQELICSTLFFSINWIREVINVFSTQDDPETKGKILSRLETSSQLFSMLEKCLLVIPNFVPPQAIFDADETTIFKPPPPHQSEKTSKKTTKKKSSKKDSDETADDQSPEKDTDNDKDSVTDDRAEDKSKDRSGLTWSHYRQFLREFDLPVFNVLKYGAVSKNILDSEQNTKETEVLALKTSSLKLLLEDLDCKLHHALPSTSAARKSVFKKKAGKDVGFSNLSKTSSTKIAELLVDLLPFLCDHLEMINSDFQNILDKSDVVIDANEADNEEYNNMGQNFRLILSCFHALFAWEKLKYNSHRPILEKAVLSLATRIKPLDENLTNFQSIMREAFHYMEELSSTARDLSTAVLVLKILSSFHQLNGDNDKNNSIAAAAEKFLKTDWSKSEKTNGQKHNESLLFLLKLRIAMSDKPLETLELLASSLAEFLEEKNTSSHFPTLNKNSFAIFYKATLEELTSTVKSMLADTPENSDEILAVAKSSVKVFYLLISMVKVMDTRSVLSSSLKLGRLFLEVFLKNCMPVLDLRLKTNKDEVHGLLKNLQQSTRCLHHFCGHSKVTQDVVMTNYVPSMKKCLEMFVFRVKAMLATNRCHSAFWLGNLKNRDIHGNEIQSQMSIVDEDGEEDSEQVTEVDQEMDDQEEISNAEDKSYSQSF